VQQLRRRPGATQRVRGGRAHPGAGVRASATTCAGLMSLQPVTSTGVEARTARRRWWLT
jgi:hypothetical protein